MEYIVNHIPYSQEKRPGTALDCRYITIHSTGNPSSSARNERAWLTNSSNDRWASWHICVDENVAVEAIPLGEIAYHAGTNTGNKHSIGIEICESGNREKALQNAALLAAKLLVERNLTVEYLRRHHDWSGKICPRIFSQNNWEGWEDFKNKVQAEFDYLKGKEEKELRYQTIEEMPDWAQTAIKTLVDKGFLAGVGCGLDLSLDMIRIFVINFNAGLYD